MKKEIRKHLLDYLLLITAGIFFLIGINVFKGERFIEFVVLLVFASFYIVWGTYHHVRHQSLRLKIMIEYILIAFTLVFLLKFIIFP